MKLIIDIPDEVLETKHYCQYFGAWSDKLFVTIENGTPYNPSGDCISREALKKEIFRPVSYDAYEDLWDAVRKAIDNAPAVEMNALPKIHYDRGFIAGYEKGKAEGILKAETRPQGEWKTVEGIDGDEYYECSNCGEPWVLMAGTPKDNNMNFCPNCGAKMKGRFVE